MRKTKHRGIARVAADFLLNLIAYNLIRIPKNACRLAIPRQDARNTRLENYIQLRRVAPTTIGKNKKTLHFKVLADC
jgi:hypothetical protein